MNVTQSPAPSAWHHTAEGAAHSAPVSPPVDDTATVNTATVNTATVDATTGHSAETREAAASRHRLEVHVDRVDSILVITPIGEIDILTGGLFLEALIAAVSTGETRLIVDLRQVPFMDSTGPTIFVSAHRALRTMEGELHIVAQPAIADVFRLSWMDRFFPVHADIADAVAALEASAA